MLIDTLKEINEGRSESGRGSKAGREKFASKEGTKGRSVKAKKSRVKVYDTIDAALHSGAPYGTIFSTKAADRLYVISKPTWGAKSRAGGNTRIAKGFTPGSATPNATWPSIKSHAVRTMIKHGKTKAGRLNTKYGPGRDPDEGKPKGKKLKEANYPKKSKKLAEILPLLTLIKRKLMEGDAVARRDQVRTRGTQVALPTGTQWVDRTQTGSKEKDADFTEVKDKVHKGIPDTPLAIRSRDNKRGKGPKIIDVKGTVVNKPKLPTVYTKPKSSTVDKKPKSSTVDKKPKSSTVSPPPLPDKKKEKRDWSGLPMYARAVKAALRTALPKLSKWHGPVHK